MTIRSRPATPEYRRNFAVVWPETPPPKKLDKTDKICDNGAPSISPAKNGDRTDK